MTYEIIVFLPLVGFLFAGQLGRVIEPRTAELVTTSFLGVCCFFSWLAFFAAGLSYDTHPYVVPVANWMTSGKLAVAWALSIDT